MSIDMDMNLSQQQQQHLSQLQIQSLAILSFDTVELNQFLREEYLENPMLEYTEKFPNIAKTEVIRTYSNLFPCDRHGTEISDAYAHAPEKNIKSHLLEQLNISSYTKSELAVMSFLIDCLDEYGYFPFTSVEIAEQTGIDLPLIDRCLETLRGLSPAGIFSSDTSDCLICQLDPDSEDYDLMKSLISRHLEDVAAGRINFISRALQISTADVRR